ncbi:hypothetical protein ASG78_05055 [Nostocoides sp. Soil756]|nr:hypothetical protein ASG78_05055 [Tetrasphaera sp. Soil756]
MRTSRIDRPLRRASPVISPSRGPGPSWLPMYRAPANPLPTIPTTIRGMRAPRVPTGGSTPSMTSVASPTTTALRTVPRPGHWRSGIHSRSTTKLVAITIRPYDSGRWSVRP